MKQTKSRRPSQTRPGPAASDPATKALRELRLKLVAEELTELCDALGVKLEVIRSAKDGDLVEAADALGDPDYVVSGANLVLVFGFPAEGRDHGDSPR